MFHVNEGFIFHISTYHLRDGIMISKISKIWLFFSPHNNLLTAEEDTDKITNEFENLWHFKQTSEMGICFYKCTSFIMERADCYRFFFFVIVRALFY